MDIPDYIDGDERSKLRYLVGLTEYDGDVAHASAIAGLTSMAGRYRTRAQEMPERTVGRVDCHRAAEFCAGTAAALQHVRASRRVSQ